MNNTQEDVLKGYQEDLEEASRRGLLPSRQKFRNMLNLDLVFSVEIDYNHVIRDVFPSVEADFSTEGISNPRVFWQKFQPIGKGSGVHNIRMNLLRTHSAISVVENEVSLAESSERYATLGEALCFIKQNPNSFGQLPLITVYEFDTGMRAAVFIGSLSGGNRRVIRFRSIDSKWKGCHHLIVSQ